MAATISDIAKAAGVSLATVSRVLNNSGYVKEETKEKILKAIKDYNYTPSAIARSLSKKQTNTIGVIVPDITNPFYGEMIRGITKVAEEHGLNILLWDSHESVEREIKSIQALREHRIRGILITPTSSEDDRNAECIKNLENLGIPVVLIDGHLKYSNFSGIFVDNIQGSYDAVNALIKENHKKIAIITGRMNSKTAQERLEGYERALLENKISINKNYILYGDYSLESGYNLTKDILSMKDKPTAIFTSSNQMTVGALKALSEHNLKTPEDISLIAFDKVDIFNILGLNISYVDGPSTELGEIGMSLLLEFLNSEYNNKEEKKITLTPTLILKGSEKLIKK